jgi:hypothetical protein
MPRISFAVALLLSMFSSLARAAEPLPPIPRIFPPVGMKPDEATSKKLRGLVEELERDLRPFDPRGKNDAGQKNLDETLFADVAIYPKAVRFALDYDEFYKPTDIADAEKLLTIGRARLKELQDGVKEPSWTKQRGLVVRGYISAIDDSVQPYGLHIPEDLDLTKKPPLYIWLHGRQEKTLDLQFITERAKNKGKFAADDAITVHPFGRYNNAFKFAGERDVLDVMFHTERLYKTDPTKRVLMGFSMGGAGCWHIGAHYPHLFCAMAPGAGFSESRRFLKIKDDALPPWYEQVLWQWYDVPSYTRNLFNLPVIAYSGEKDGQKQAADVMEAEFAKYGRKLNHIIGPGMGHDYDQGSLDKIRAELKAITAKPKSLPLSAEVQTPMQLYGTNRILEIITLEKPWTESNLSLEVNNLAKPQVKITDQSVLTYAFDLRWQFEGAFKITVDLIMNGKKINDHQMQTYAQFSKVPTSNTPEWHHYVGPIDVAFMQPFIFVTPTGKSKSKERQEWVERELTYQINRWRRTFRGDPILIRDQDFKPEEFVDKNIVFWGDEESNSAIAEFVKTVNRNTNNDWRQLFSLNETANNILVSIFPKKFAKKPLPQHILPEENDPWEIQNGRFFVLNSGPTFRDEHDRNNANQIPKLPDWAVIDVTTPGDAKSPGRVVTAGFFNNDWKYVDPAKQQAEFEARQKKQQ